MEQQIPVEKKIHSLWPDDDDVPASKSSVDLTTRVWRSGDLLVMDRHSRLPDVCLLTGLPATHRVERELSYHPPNTYLWLLLGINTYLATVLDQAVATIPIEVPLCEQMFRRKQAQLLFAKILGGMGAAAIFGAIAFGSFTKEHEIAVVVIAVGAAIGLAGLAFGYVGSWPVTAHMIDPDYIWLSGVHRDYLKTLPEWPGK